VTVRRIPLRLVLVVAVLVALACAPSALARGGAGHNSATKKLEDAFKIALYVRSVSLDGCYPPVRQLAKKIAQTKRGLKVGVASGPDSIHRRNVVFLLRKDSSCNEVMMALRASSGLYVLNSAQGTIRVQGRAGPRVVPGKPGPPRGVGIVSRTFRMSAPDQLTRHEVICPGGRYPIGGGMLVNEPPGSDGEGIYPHSYERLGAQRGFHISAVLFDDNWSFTTSRSITIQAICARGQIPQNPTPHKTVFILPGQTKTAVARCPKGQQLITGGFQRTNFGSDGGNYVTESRAVGTRAWKVTGSAYIGSGTTGGGELTAIAYCVKSKKPILLEVNSEQVPVPAGMNASTTSAGCPGGRQLTTTGFALDSRNAFYAGSSLNVPPSGSGSTISSTTAHAFGYLGPAQLIAYGYCQRTR
jgi:hypothetical protein